MNANYPELNPGSRNATLFGMKRLRIVELSLAGILLAGALIFFHGCGRGAGSGGSTGAVSSNPVISISEPTEAQPKLPTVKLWIGAEQMDAEMCVTWRQTQTGMMFRKTMGENDGMIFNLGRSEQAGFWMKNCFVPLSVAYIDPDGVILEIHPLQVQDTNTVYSSSSNVRFALETPQGWFDKHNIKPGTVIRSERGTLKQTFGQNQ